MSKLEEITFQKTPLIELYKAGAYRSCAVLGSAGLMGGSAEVTAVSGYAFLENPTPVRAVATIVSAAVTAVCAYRFYRGLRQDGFKF